MATIQKIVPCLWFDTHAEDAAKFYVSVFPHSRIDRITHYTSQGKEIMELFKKLNETGTTIIQVTHSETNAGYGSRIIQLRDGWVVEE